VVHTACVTFGEAGSFELGTDGPTVILVGVDGSPTSLRAGAYAAGLARRQGARLVVVYVGPVASLAAAMPGAGGAVVVAHDEAFDETSDDLRRQVEGQAQERGIAAAFVVRRGDPFSELRRVAGEVRAEAVVVGASAKAGHRLVGSVAVRLVRAGKWPVTVVP
jgi:nucleotide-binding universal stress UspA family protein